MAAQDGSEDAANKIAGIFSTVVGEAEELTNSASQQELEGNYEQAITLYDGVAPALTIVKKKYSDQYQTAQRLIQSAAQKKAAAQQSLEKLKTEPSTKRGISVWQGTASRDPKHRLLRALLKLMND